MDGACREHLPTCLSQSHRSLTHVKFSRALAIVFGFLAPATETIRRWNSWRDFPPGLFDEILWARFSWQGLG